ncbi:MAG: DGQHR domain-containing protein [Sphingomonadaceae bacterium]|nr:DGQHR domain-containing protein [Sphingomonadaceae bacterium]
MIEHVKPTARMPAVQGQFGPRLLTYTTQLPAGAIETIIGHDPRSKHWKKLSGDLSYIYEHLQRQTSKGRLDSLIRYIRYRFIERPVIIGAFPALAVAVQNPTDFEKIEGESGIGVLHFDLSRRNKRVLVDGLGRASAALELVELAEAPDLLPEARDSLQKLLKEFTLPTVFYVPAPGTPSLSLEEMQQLFHDFNFRVAKVKESVAIALDHSDLYIGLTNRIGQSDLLRMYGGMERKAASLGAKSSAIVVQQTLLKFVRAATEGERFADGANNQESSRPNLNEETFPDFEEAILDFLEAFSSSMGNERFKDRESIHLSAPSWMALGVIFNDLYVKLKVGDLRDPAAALGRIDWTRTAPHWSEIVKPKVNKKGEQVLGLLGGGGAQNRRMITAVVRQVLHIDDLLRERGFSTGDDGSAAEAADVTTNVGSTYTSAELELA